MGSLISTCFRRKSDAQLVQLRLLQLVSERNSELATLENLDQRKLETLSLSPPPPSRVDVPVYPSLRKHSYIASIPSFKHHCPDAWGQICTFLPELARKSDITYHFHHECIAELLRHTAAIKPDNAEEDERDAKCLLLVRLLHVWHHELGDCRGPLDSFLCEESDASTLVVLVDLFAAGLDPALWEFWKKENELSMSRFGALMPGQIRFYQNMLAMHHLAMHRRATGDQ